MKRLDALRGSRRSLVRAAVLLVVVAAVGTAFVFVPGLRQTPVSRALRFWDEPPPPEPAVPAGALGEEMATKETSGDVIAIDAAKAESLGLQTVAAEFRSPDGGVRTTGRVVTDERRTATVSTKIEGWVEETFGNYEGQEIRAGQPLYTVYSPDLYSGQQEYLLALKARKDFEKSEFEVVRNSGKSLVDASRRRLELWNVSRTQIIEIERTGRPIRAITMTAPASGVIVERKVFPGARISPDMLLYTLADLSTVWVEADVFEVDLAGLQHGSTADILLPSSESRVAKVTFISPMVDSMTRTAKVRLELPNPGRQLKPGMFVEVSLRTVNAPQLVVPRDAVLDTGMRKLVLVDGGSGTFTLREITTGTERQDVTVVVSGLTAGERVARNIQFLIDSETELRKAVNRQGTPAPTSAPGGSGAHGSHGAPQPTGPEVPR